MRSYLLLRELVRDCGGRLVDEQPTDKSAQQWCAMFEGRTHKRYRMCWDGKGKHATLQVLEPGGQWGVIGPEVRKVHGVTYSNLRAFLETAERLAGTREATETISAAG